MTYEYNLLITLYDKTQLKLPIAKLSRAYHGVNRPGYYLPTFSLVRGFVPTNSFGASRRQIRNLIRKALETKIIEKSYLFKGFISYEAFVKMSRDMRHPLLNDIHGLLIEKDETIVQTQPKAKTVATLPVYMEDHFEFLRKFNCADTIRISAIKHGNIDYSVSMPVVDGFLPSVNCIATMLNVCPQKFHTLLRRAFRDTTIVEGVHFSWNDETSIKRPPFMLTPLGLRTLLRTQSARTLFPHHHFKLIPLQLK